jgi:arylsulfatase A-like enzyme
LVATNHSVATGTVVDMATGYPGYNSVIPREAVAIGEILRQHGYDTSWYGGAKATLRTGILGRSLPTLLSQW